MVYEIQKIASAALPPALNEIPQPPQHLYIRGAGLDRMQEYIVAVVGARRHSSYGKLACEKIIKELAGSPITIVSGLAIGIDTVAHQAALQNNLHTVAVVGSGLDDSVLYPALNKKLAYQILEKGGSLISECEPTEKGSRYSFPKRNRIMAGLAQLIIAVECEERSGTRITTRLAIEYGKDVGAVPHNIFSELGKGTNALIQQGAYVIRDGQDIKAILGLEQSAQNLSAVLETLTETEKKVYALLETPQTKTQLAEKLSLQSGVLQATLAMLEMKNLTTETMGRIQRLS